MDAENTGIYRLLSRLCSGTSPGRRLQASRSLPCGRQRDDRVGECREEGSILPGLVYANGGE